MDEQSNSDLSLTVSEKTSISSDGPSPSVVESPPKIAYKDASGSLSVILLNGRLHVGAILNKLQVPYSRIKHWQTVIFAFDKQLKSKGISHYYCTVSDIKGYRFATFMGFKDTDEISEHENYLLLRKDL